MSVSLLNAYCCSCCAANRKAKGAGNPGKPGKKLRLEDLQSQFGVGLKEAANRLGICPTTLKACTQHAPIHYTCVIPQRALSVCMTNSLAIIDWATACPALRGRPRVHVSVRFGGKHDAMCVLCREHAGGMAFSAGRAASCSS